MIDISTVEDYWTVEVHLRRFEIIFGARDCAFNIAIRLDLDSPWSLRVWRFFPISVIATASSFEDWRIFDLKMRVEVLE